MHVMLAALLLLAACNDLPQSPECEKFLACSEAAEPHSTRNTHPTYGPGGTCWQNASDAAACTEVCKLATLAVRADAGRTTPQCN
jgi:hypothetical protein